MDKDFVVSCLTAYKTALAQINKKQDSRDYLLYGDWNGKVKDLQDRAGRFWALALEAGYDPVRDIDLYQGI